MKKFTAQEVREMFDAAEAQPYVQNKLMQPSGMGNTYRPKIVITREGNE